MAHINGLRDMICLRGGLQALHNPLVTQLTILYGVLSTVNLHMLIL
jgi:hypothetical protein